MEVYRCTSCMKTTSNPLLRGNTMITILLCCMFIVPGVIYSIWRRGGSGICPACKKEALIPYESDVTVSSCEWCAEEVKVTAKVCKHCNREITPQKIKTDNVIIEHKATESLKLKQRGQVFFIISVVFLVLFVFAKVPMLLIISFAFLLGGLSNYHVIKKINREKATSLNGYLKMWLDVPLVYKLLIVIGILGVFVTAFPPTV